MLQEERYNKILDLLKEKKFIKVEDLAKTLSVSDMTIRRDLEKCKEAGLLTRCHGGAMLVERNRQEVSFDDKSAENDGIKQKIAQESLALIQDGMTVFLDAGTTTYRIAQQLQSFRGLTVISNDIRIMYHLLDSDTEAWMIGGRVQKSTGSAIGLTATEMIENMSFDIAFCGVNSINGQFDVMTPTIEKVDFKRQVLKNSSECYLVTDHSKFRTRALHRINSLGEYAGVITDYACTKEETRLAQEKKINFIQI